jgi:hypothetical protein
MSRKMSYWDVGTIPLVLRVVWHVKLGITVTSVCRYVLQSLHREYPTRRLSLDRGSDL